MQNYERVCGLCRSANSTRPRPICRRWAGASKELADRASVHLNICSQHLDRAAIQFKTQEEHFDYAVSLMNVGDYVTAREHLEKFPGSRPKLITWPTAWPPWIASLAT